MRFLLLLLAAAASSAPALPQENVLILLADDVGVDYLGCYAEGPSPANTPNLDALAAGGVLFRNVWAAPICSATRAQVMSGRYGFRTEIGHVVDEDHALALSELTLPEVLGRRPDLGFTHAAFGKWHLGNDDVGGDLAPSLAGWSLLAGPLTKVAIERRRALSEFIDETLASK